MDPHNPGGPPPGFPGQFLPPGFDINSLSPADREALLRRIQQYQQMQRVRQQQQPRPPPNAFPPQMRPPGMMPMGQMPQQYMQGPFVRPSPAAGINPQFFHNPYAYTQVPPPQVMRPVPPLQHTGPMPPPHDDSIFASEGAFTEHLIRFLNCNNFPEKRIPNIAGKPVQLLRLYQLICSVGGCANVAGDLKKWQRVAAALQIPTDSVENLTMLRSTYLIFLYPYEQYYFQKKPLERIECKLSSLCIKEPIVINFVGPHKKQQQLQQMQQQKSSAQALAQSIPTALPIQSPTPAAAPPSVAAPQAPPVLFIPDSELLAWKPYAAVAMKAPAKAMDIDSIILNLTSPFRSLQFDGLLALQKYLTSVHNNRILNLPTSSLPSLIKAFEQLCSSDSDFKNAAGKEYFWTFESLLAAEDVKRRDLLIDHLEKKTVLIEQVSLTLQLLIATRHDLVPLIAPYPFISQFLHYSLRRCESVEVKMNSFIILEAVSTFLTESQEADELFSWSLRQAALELKQICAERLKSSSIKLASTLNSLNFDSFDSTAAARQTTNLVITNLGQFWKTIPAHLFSLLSSTVHLLCNKNVNDASAEDEVAYGELVKELLSFAELFFIPICALVRSLHSYLKVLIEDTRAIEELKKILETLLFSPSFSLSDGGYLELSLQLLSKCLSKCKATRQGCKLDSLLLLVEEMRNLWLLPPMQVQLGKSCFATLLPTTNGSPKRGRLAAAPVVTNELAITKGSSSITSAHSHPFMILSRSLDLLAVNFDSLSFETQLRLFEFSMEWSLDSTGHCQEVLNCERLEAPLSKIRDKLFTE